MSERMNYGEFMETEHATSEVLKIAELSFAYGKVGERNRLETSEAEQYFANKLAEHTVPLTKTNTAFCGDDRPRVKHGDGTADPMFLQNLVVPKLLGGIGIASTKACVAADSPIVRGATSFEEAYERVQRVLAGMGEEDAGHAGCGASMAVESSVANQIPRDSLIQSIALFVPDAPELTDLIDLNTHTKQRQLDNGLYAGWDVDWHVHQLQNRYPANLSFVAVDDSDLETKGHHGSGIYVVDEENMGFAKNAFTQDTGQEAFSVTQSKMVSLANRLGGSEEERVRLLLAFIDDTLHVSAGIVSKDMPVFA